MLNTKQLPILDRREDQPRLSADMNEILDVRGCEQFIEAHPEYYAIPENFQTIRRWLLQHGNAPWSLKNLEIAFRELRGEGKIVERPEPTPIEESPESAEPSNNRGITHFGSRDTVRRNHPAPSPEELERLRKAHPKKLRLEYQQSLTRKIGKLPPRWNEARAAVRVSNPHLRVDSAEFNAAVAQLVKEME